MTKRIGLVVSAVILTFSLVLLSACGGNKQKTLTSENIYSFSVLTGAKFNSLNGATTNALVDSGMVLHSTNLDNEATPVVSEDLETIDDYLETIESFLGDSPIVVSESTASDYEVDGEKPYEFMMTYEVKNIHGVKEVYTLHYNEKVKEIEEDDDEIEIESVLTGIIVYGEERFEFYGKKEVEMESDEHEVTFQFIIKRDENTRIEMKYEKDVEDDEQEEKFMIKEYVNGKKVRESKVKIEIEDDEYELKVELKDENGKVIKLKIEDYNKHGYQYVIKYEIDRDDQEDFEEKIYVKVITDEATGNITYEYTVKSLKGKDFVKPIDRDDD